MGGIKTKPRFRNLEKKSGRNGKSRNETNYVYKTSPIFMFALKGTNGRQKTYEFSHVYSIFYSGFMC